MATIAVQQQAWQDNNVEKLLIINANKIILENQILINGHIIIDKLVGKIVEINEGTYDSSSSNSSNVIVNNVEYVIPGFIDIHNHGLGGTKDVLDYWTCPEFSLRKLYKAGTTSIFPTITFPDPPRLERSLKAVKVLSSLYLKNNSYGCRVEGIVSVLYYIYIYISCLIYVYLC